MSDDRPLFTSRSVIDAKFVLIVKWIFHSPDVLRLSFISLRTYGLKFSRYFLTITFSLLPLLRSINLRYLQYFLVCNFWLCRSSHPKVSCNKMFLKISQNSQENICARISFFVSLFSFRKASWLFSWHYSQSFSQTQEYD